MRVAPPDFAALSAERRKLRASLNAQRRSVTSAARAQAARRVARHVDRALHLQAHWRIALYAALPWELDTAPLITLAAARGCRIYLPRIERRRASRVMRFAPLAQRLRPNRLGIDEPRDGATLGARWLDVVFVPLVGFDAQGLRLGAGGGFYDRAFAFRLLRSSWQAPRLVGLGYSFQQLGSLEAAAHDVRLDAVVTEEGMIRCATG